MNDTTPDLIASAGWVYRPVIRIVLDILPG